MWLFFKSIFMIKDRSIGKEMVAENKPSGKLPGVKLARLLRRRNRRSQFKAHNTTHLKFKVK